MEKRPFICRSCGSGCPILVSVDGDRVVAVEGDFDAPIYRGYTCVKGRMLGQEYHNPRRLLHSLKRMPDGRFVPISNADLVDEVAERLGRILDEHGPQAVGAFLGSAVQTQPAAANMLLSFLTAIGSPHFYSNGTLDQPGLSISLGLHGNWLGGRVHPDQWDAKLIVGGNPVVSKQHLPQNPAWQLKQMKKRGAGLVVIDPARSETARYAAVHLQPLPGEDPTILAGLIHLIFAMDGVDRDFVDRHSSGVEELRQAVSGFTPEYVAARASVAVEDLVAAAKVIAGARRGDTALGVGPSMATRGTLTSYLALCIQTLRGWWAREGEMVARPRVLTPQVDWRAQPADPRPGWGFGLTSPVRGLQQTIAGMPVAAAPELMLSEGKDRIRAFFSHGGIYHSWPETPKTEKALRALDLYVTHDVEMTSTAELAHYVIATRNQLEMSASSYLSESIGDIHPGYDWTEPYGAWREAVMSPPEGSDLMEAWQIYFRVARKLGIPLSHMNFSFTGMMSEPIPYDMDREPTTDELFGMTCVNSAVPLEEVRRHPHGAVFEEARGFVGPGDPDCTARLQLADPAMIGQLGEVRAEETLARRKTSDEFPLLLTCRRMMDSFCTTHRPEGMVRTGYNPLRIHPDDMASLGLASGDAVEIRSRHGAVTGFAESDETMRPGAVGLAFGFGKRAGRNYNPREDGCNVNELISWIDDYDPYHGMPRMSAIPVSVTKLALA